ncbi:DUF6880 family protein [Caulobacter sp. KR2-114]|uniref:DUF6880 family protein n=1 Tax=Caulobacter sp. KR2-114 TaxID=3400912 RepID=UPI003C098E99
MDSKTPTKRPRSKTVNAANLEALGAERLAAILLEAADEQPAVKRRLRLALAAAAGPEVLAADLAKALDSARAARGRIPWRKLRTVRQELDLLRATIAGPLAEADPAAGVVLMLGFVGLQRPVLARTKDAKGEMAALFAEALEDLARLAPLTPTAPAAISELAFAVLDDLPVAAMGPVTQALAPALDGVAVAELRARIETAMAPQRRVNAGWRLALQALLDRQGDAAAYADSFSASEAVLPPVGARIARRFLAAGQLDDAARALQCSSPFEGLPKGAVIEPDPGVAAWEEVSIDLKAAQGDAEGAQAARWAAFERHLSPDILRAYLRPLKGFDDVVAVEKALEHALAAPSFTAALGFLIAWPALKEAAALVEARSGEIDPEALDVLEPAVRALEGRHPLAAILILRRMVLYAALSDDRDLAKRTRTWMLEAESLAHQISDFGPHDTHARFEQRVYRHIGRP